MVRIKISGQNYNVPTNWKEVSVKQFQQIKTMNPDDLVELIAIMTGAPYSVVDRCKDLDVDEKVLPLLEFMKTKLTEENMPKAEYFNFQGKKYKIPTDIGDCTLGQKITATKAINKAQSEFKDTNAALAEVTAIYMQPVIQGKEFNREAYEALIPEIEQCSIVEVYQVGGFFLKKLVEFQNARLIPYPLNTIKIKWLREYVRLKYLQRSIRLMRSRKEISYVGKQS